MARLPPITVPGQALRIIQRGNNRQRVFFDPQDYQRYLDDVEAASRRYGCAIHAYVLMTNHVHLLVTPSNTEGPSRMMQAVGRRYVRYLNATYQRTGTLWEGRFKSGLIDSERYLLSCSHYIELNPVCAGMVTSPGDYPWSSYAHNALRRQDSRPTPHPLYGALGQSGPESQTA